MHIDVPYKILKLKPEQELLDFNFDLITEEDWTQNRNLQKMFPRVFGQTDTFILMYFTMDNWEQPHGKYPVKVNNEHPIHSLIMDEVYKLEKLYNASAKIVTLDRMAPGATIGRHFDKSNIYELCHRVHLPLVTHSKVDFYIDDVKHNFKAGEFFEFNNRMFHQVDNNSNIYRIHLVVDLLPNL